MLYKKNGYPIGAPTFYFVELCSDKGSTVGIDHVLSFV